MSATRRHLCLTWMVLATGWLPGIAAADKDGATAPDPKGKWAWNGDAAGLHCLSLCELDQLYECATVDAAPCGFLQGEVIKFTNMPAPDLAKRLADRHWVGKHIEADGYFINQWKRRKALDSCLHIGPSYVDGNPAIIFEYPWYTPLFGPMRDEYREIAPGLFLGKMYRRRPCVRFLGYNYLQFSSCGAVPCAPVGSSKSVDAEPDIARVEHRSRTAIEPATCVTRTQAGNLHDAQFERLLEGTRMDATYRLTWLQEIRR